MWPLISENSVVAGGFGSSVYSSAELYDPATGTWIPTGSMSIARTNHTATLLDNGKVLVAGGYIGSYSGPYLASAELYDPVTEAWSTTGNMNVARYDHSATLLNDGKVLVVGGGWGSSNLASAELYDPVTGTWSTTGNMNVGRIGRTATLLNNGQVLVAGGYGNDSLCLPSSELYDPDIGTWSTTSSMSFARGLHSATLLNNGKVLVVGGSNCEGQHLASTELYDPNIGTWIITGSIYVARYDHTATLLNDEKVLIATGTSGSARTTSSELFTLIPGNTFTGTLTLPSEWLNSTNISAQFIGSSSDAAINAGALSNDNTTWGSWLAASPGLTTSTTWNVAGEGANKPVYLRLRDVNDQMATVVTGTVNVDLTKPTSSISTLPATSPANIALAWSGSDTLSGLSTYNVQVRAGTGGAWEDVFTNTSAISTTYNGIVGMTYYFRTRAKDMVGNIEEWPPDYDTYTLVDTDAPTGTLVINNGALSATYSGVKLTLSAQDVSGSVAQMSFSNDGNTWSSWQTYAGSVDWSLSNGDGLKTVYVRFKDIADNVSSPISSVITLDAAAGTEYGLSINEGALFTNQVTVTLVIAARQFTPQMMVCNDGGFAGAQWEPYNSRKAWAITQYGSYVIPRVVYVRYKDLGGNVSSNYQDDIILDVTPPEGTVSIIGAAGLQAMASTVTLELSATDDLSGVGQMLISNQPDFAGATWESYATSRAWALGSNETVYVQYKDNAGNVSTTYSTSQWKVFLPLIQK